MLFEFIVIFDFPFSFLRLFQLFMRIFLFFIVKFIFWVYLFIHFKLILTFWYLDCYCLFEIFKCCISIINFTRINEKLLVALLYQTCTLFLRFFYFFFYLFNFFFSLLKINLAFVYFRFHFLCFFYKTLILYSIFTQIFCF